MAPTSNGLSIGDERIAHILHPTIVTFGGTALTLEGVTTVETSTKDN